MKEYYSSKLFDYSEDKQAQYGVSFSNPDYCVISVYNHRDLKSGEYILNRATGDLQRFDFYRNDERKRT